MPKLPKARTADILEQEVDKELLIYDLRIDTAYNLSETSKIVYKACNGKNGFDELKSRHRLTDEIIYLALEGLKQRNLVEESADDFSPFAGMSRREVIKKVGLATMIALPVISTLVAPTAAMAASACTTTQTNARGTCFSVNERCVNGVCSPCIPTGQPVSGRCNFAPSRQCCSSACNTASNNCV